MSQRNLDKLFRPRSIAVIGATDRPHSVGSTVLRNLLEGGFPGPVFPVNPHRASVRGLPAYRDVAALPEPADLAVICTPAATVIEVVRQLSAAGIRGAVLLSAGFGESGAAGRRLDERLRAELARSDGLRLLGPNCLGLIVPGQGLNASFAAATPAAGQVAFISQSGALCTSVLDWAIQEGIGFSHFVSVGNMLDVGFGDLIDYLANDQHTRSIALYVESITHPRHFMSAARAFARDKPIVVYKAGRFAASAQAAASHTGALVGVDDVYEAAFQRAGLVRVLEIDDMFGCAELLARGKLPRGPRLGIVTNAGGPGVIAADALLAQNGHLAELSTETLARLDALLPDFWSHGNPVDLLGDARDDRYARATQLVLDDGGVDAVLVILTPQAMTDPTAVARAVGQVAEQAHKPILACWMGGRTVRPGIDELNSAGVPTYAAPGRAVQAFMYLTRYAHNREALYETPREIAVDERPDRQRVEAHLQAALADGRELLSERASKELLEAYGIPATMPHAAGTAAEAVDVARAVGYPVVAKILSPDITHKTDVAGVALNLTSDDDVRSAFERLTHTARRLRPEAHIEGISVQRMVVAPDGVEMLLGAKKDALFGTVLVAGAGGVITELIQDRALDLPPLNERLASRMLESLRAWPLLCGFRGRPACDVDRLTAVLVRLSHLVADFGAISELDVNPLLVTHDEAVALDARIVIDRAALEQPPRRFAHLSIRPYPDEFVRSTQLKDGTPVLLRPIRPQDEPLWHDLLARCSQRSIWQRFRYLVPHTSHDVAVRFCFNDYDREVGIVAEITDGGQRQFIGVGRLVADPDHRDAEYAVLVADQWQGRGLGSLLTSYCLEIARQWNLQRVYAETTADNARMIALMRRTSYRLGRGPDATIVVGTKEL